MTFWADFGWTSQTNDSQLGQKHTVRAEKCNLAKTTKHVLIIMLFTVLLEGSKIDWRQDDKQIVKYFEIVPLRFERWWLAEGLFSATFFQNLKSLNLATLMVSSGSGYLVPRTTIQSEMTVWMHSEDCYCIGFDKCIVEFVGLLKRMTWVMAMCTLLEGTMRLVMWAKTFYKRFCWGRCRLVSFVSAGSVVRWFGQFGPKLRNPKRSKKS